MRFWLCIDDTDDATKSVGTGQIANGIFKELQTMGCRMKYNITRHQLVLNPAVPYTSHNSAMCMAGEGILSPEEVWQVAERVLMKKRSRISNPGICLYVPRKDSDEERLVAFGRRAKREVLTLSQARAIAREVPGIRLEAPAGNGDGQIGALAGIGLRLSGNDGTFRGKVTPERPNQIYTVKEMKRELDLDFICDGSNRTLSDEEQVRAKDYVKVVYRNFGRAAAAEKQEDGTYDLCDLAFVYEQNLAPGGITVRNCSWFAWDNDCGEQWSDKPGRCENCLYRRLTGQGMVCSFGRKNERTAILPQKQGAHV